MPRTDVAASPAHARPGEAEPSVSIIVPLYNEEASVEELYRRTVDAVEPLAPFELIFVEDGFDVASGRRGSRRDSWGRTLPSRLINGMLRRFTGVAIADFGCAFNAYRRTAVEPMLGAIGKQKFTKALVLSGGASVVEVDVGHAPRHGRSRYSPLRLTSLALHVLAGFWPQPIQWIGIALGVVCTVLALALGAYGIGYWIDNSNFPGPLFGGVAVLFWVGVQGFILALVGEYLGRIQRQVEGRPLYTIDRELD